MFTNSAFETTKTQLAAANVQAIEFAETNTKAAFAFAREALAAKSPETLWSLQQAYLKAQQEAAVAQSQALAKSYADMFKVGANPLADALKPFMGK
jgi:hypothetical protein